MAVRYSSFWAGLSTFMDEDLYVEIAGMRLTIRHATRRASVTFGLGLRQTLKGLVLGG
jgi:hypothetical protein